MSDDPHPDQTLPGDLDDDLDEDGNPKPVAPNQDLPDDPSQGVAHKSGERGKSAQAPGRNKPK